MMARLLLALCICLSIVPVHTTRAATPAELAGESAREFETAIATAQPRLVKIYGGSIGRTPGYASGILVSADGDILTAYGVHLAGGSIRVTLADGEQHYATLVRHDLSLQTALLKIAAKTPDYFNLTDPPPAVEGGDWILALNNAFKVAEGSEPLSLNLGVFTARTRLDARRGAQDFPYGGDVLLFDAITSNPGAAGGAVVNADGQLLGMIGRVVEGRHLGTRLNYAFPADVLSDFVLHPERLTPPEPATLARSTAAPPGDLGIRLFALGGRKGPAFVDRVVAESPAAQAGIKTDDLVVSLDGQAIRTSDDFHKAIARILAGQQVKVEVKRKNAVVSFTLIAVGKPQP